MCLSQSSEGLPLFHTFDTPPPNNKESRFLGTLYLLSFSFSYLREEYGWNPEWESYSPLEFMKPWVFHHEYLIVESFYHEKRDKCTGDESEYNRESEPRPELVTKRDREDTESGGKCCQEHRFQTTRSCLDKCRE